MIQIELLDGLMEGQRKIIGEETAFIPFGEKQFKNIRVNIREGDIDWYKQNYNIQAFLFRTFTLLGKSIQIHSSSPQGINIKTKLCEKEKVKILKMNVPETIEDPECDYFFVEVWVNNAGEFTMDSSVNIYLIEKPSMIPGFDQLNIPGLSTVRKELSISEKKSLKPSSADSGELFKIRCYLRDLESEKKNLVIQAEVVVTIDGKEYVVDTSPLFEIYHEQPICREETCWLLIIGAVFIGLIGFCLIAIIVRILYPLYKIKKIDLKEKKDIIDKKKNK